MLSTRVPILVICLTKSDTNLLGMYWQWSMEYYYRGTLIFPPYAIHVLHNVQCILHTQPFSRICTIAQLVVLIQPLHLFIDSIHHRVYSLPGFAPSRPNWVPPTLSPASECCPPPLWVQGGDITAYDGGDGETQLRRRDIHSGTLYVDFNPSTVYTRWLSCLIGIRTSFCERTTFR
jgi:hypothetical protein